MSETNGTRASVIRAMEVRFVIDQAKGYVDGPALVDAVMTVFAEELAKVQAERDRWRELFEMWERAAGDERESRFRWAEEAAHLETRLAANVGFPPDWERQLAACESSGAGVDLVRTWLAGRTDPATLED